MLVLKRRQGQEIVIEDQTGGQIHGQIRIVVVQTGEGSCSLAFEAPRECRIRRAELAVLGDSEASVSMKSPQVAPAERPPADSPGPMGPVVSPQAVSQSGSTLRQVLLHRKQSSQPQCLQSQCLQSQCLQSQLSKRQTPDAVLLNSALPDSVLSDLSLAQAALQVQS